ncbi:MAG: hypothetical protein H6917_11005 [Novosphingobium sp.]|nr:hypothetical protein [Novosphingobium sp.]MCP5402902.1 hypothetical protein [Novosphingobium sp.]
MDGASLEKTLGRIDEAIARIERTALRPAPADTDLQERHERLRSAVAQSLSQLDELLAGQQS